MARSLAASLAFALALGVAAPRAHADEPASADRIKAAAEEFDQGRRAFLAKDYENAAVHFENAYRDAPRAETLRLAIRARREGKQLARAATLAAVAQEKYSSDAATAQLARDTLAEATPQLAELQVTCVPTECSITADGRVVSQIDAREMRVFLEPGAHQVGASFKSGAVSKKIEGKKGGKEELVFEAPPEVAPATPPTTTPVPTKPAQPPQTEEPRSKKPLRPLVFWIGTGLTVVAGGVTVWSGIDTQNNPGKDRVRAECAGKDESCPAYADGRSSQLRTNVLIAATSVLAAGTIVIGVFLTDWGGGARRAGVSRPIDFALGPTSAAVTGSF